jgi:large subunit ribosomal protein L17
MRHNKKFNHLGRKTAHRKSMLANMTISLIQHKRITTTLAKAKALRVYAEPLLTKSKDDTTNSRRVVFSYLQNKEAVTELFQNISQKIADRPGGYTRILRTGLRMGDNAEMCIIELVDYNENMLKEKATKKAARTRRSSVKKTDDAPAAVAAAPAAKKAAVDPSEVVEETPVVEEVATEEEVVAEAPVAVEETVKEEVVVAEESETEEKKAE